MRKFWKVMLASVTLVAAVEFAAVARADHGHKNSSNHNGSSRFSPSVVLSQVRGSNSYPNSYPSSSHCSSSMYPSGPYFPTGNSYPQYPQQYPQPYPHYPQYPQGSPSYPQSPMPYPPQYPQYPTQQMPPNYPSGQNMPPSGVWGQPTGTSSSSGPWGQAPGNWGGYGGRGPVITVAK